MTRATPAPTRVAVLAAVFWATSASGLPGQQPPPTASAASTFSLPGRILDGTTDAPIEGALVQVAELGISAVSDANGHFVLANMSPGRFTFVTSHAEYHANQEVSAVRAGNALFVRLLSRAAPAIALAGTRGEAELGTGARVRVRLEASRWRVVARVVDLLPDTLVVAYPPGVLDSRMALAVADIRRLEVSTGRYRLTPLGVAAGALLGLIAAHSYNSIRLSQCVNRCPARPFPVIAGAGVGALAGGIGLHFVWRDRWAEISMPEPPPDSP